MLTAVRNAAAALFKGHILKYTDSSRNEMKSWWQKFYPVG